jgi:hypothetical protein
MVSFETFNSSNVSYQEIAVSVGCAKWLVAKSSTEEGNAYTAYLISHQANELETKASKDLILASLMATQSMRMKQLGHEEILATLQKESLTHSKAIASLGATYKPLNEEEFS